MPLITGQSQGSTKIGAIALAATIALGAAHHISAGPLRPELVDREASWIAHLDVERLAGSRMRDSIVAGTHPMFRKARHSLECMQEDLGGLDPYALFLDVTMYGTGEKGERVAAIFTTTAIGDELAELVREKDAYASITVRDQSLVTWRDKGRTWYAHLTRTSEKERRIIVAEDPLIVIESMDVATGARPSMVADFTSRFPDLPSEGSIFYLAGDKPDAFPHDKSTSAIVEKADRLTCDFGEIDDRLFAEVTIVAKGETDAKDISATLAGMVIMGQTVSSKSESRHRPWRSLLDRVNLRSDGLTVRMSFTAGVRRVVAAMEESHRLTEAEKAARDTEPTRSNRDGGSSGTQVNADRGEGGR